MSRMLESLEARGYLAVDLVASFRSVSIPNEVVTGASVRSSVIVAVTNAGTAVPRNAAAAKVVVGLRNADGVVRQIGSGNLLVAGLAPGQLSRAASVPVTVPADLAAGDYTVVTTVDPDNRLAETVRENNTANGKTVMLRAFRSDLVVTAKSSLSGSVSPSTKGTVTATLKNEGNGPLTTTVKFEVLAIVGDKTTVLLTLDKQKLTIAAGRSLTTRALPITVPADAKPGSLTLSVRVTQSATVAGDNLANNTGVAANLTILARPAPTGVLAELGLSPTLSFKQTAFEGLAGIGTEFGTFTDSQGRTGLYQLVRNNAFNQKLGALLLFVDERKVLDTSFTYTKATGKLDQRTVTFGATLAQSVGFIDLNNRQVFFRLGA